MINREENGTKQKSREADWLLSAFLVCTIWLLVSCLAGRSYAQNILHEPLKYPWAGGLNSCTFEPVDLNLDGKLDLVIFERLGNRILPFIQNGTSGISDYTYHPEYAALFPELR